MNNEDYINPWKIVGFVGLPIVLVLFLFFSITNTSNGYVKVVKTFGKVSNHYLTPGLSFVMPWQSTTSVYVASDKIEEHASVPTSERITVDIDVVINFSINPEKAVELYRKYGGYHKETYLIPQVKSVLRNCALKYKTEDVFDKKIDIERDTLNSLAEEVSHLGFIIETLTFNDIKPPQSVKDRIEQKMVANQEAQRMEFVVQKEKQEAERKRVEAQGIADAQQIIKKDLDEKYLIYLWIQSLESATKNGNTVIYIPTGNDGLPIFKGVK